MSDIVAAAVIGIIPGTLTVILLLMQRKQLTDVHTLVNSNMGIQLKLNAVNSRWRADMSQKTEDIKAAFEAEKLLREHDAKQATVDALT